MHGSGVKIGYFDQMLSRFPADVEVVEAVRPGHKEFTLQQRRDLLARFGIAGDMAFQRIGSLSGGERNRTALAWLSSLDATLLVLDEPTNHLDLWARGSLEAALKQFDGTVVLVSHDRYFLNQVCDHLLVVEPDRFRVIEGNYDTYVHLARQRMAVAERERALEKERAAAKAASGGRDRLDGGGNGGGPGSNAAGNGSAGGGGAAGSGSAGGAGGKVGKRKRKFPYRKADDIESEIQTREARLGELQALQISPEVLRDGRRVKEVTAEIDEQQAAIARLYEHWEEATELN